MVRALTNAITRIHTHTHTHNCHIYGKSRSDDRSEWRPKVEQANVTWNQLKLDPERWPCSLSLPTHIRTKSMQWWVCWNFWFVEPPYGSVYYALRIHFRAFVTFPCTRVFTDICIILPNWDIIFENVNRILSSWKNRILSRKVYIVFPFLRKFFRWAFPATLGARGRGGAFASFFQLCDFFPLKAKHFDSKHPSFFWPVWLNYSHTRLLVSVCAESRFDDQDVMVFAVWIV